MIQSNRLLLAEKQGLEQDDNANANQDHGANDHAIHIGPANDLHSNSDAAEKK